MAGWQNAHIHYLPNLIFFKHTPLIPKVSNYYMFLPILSILLITTDYFFEKRKCFFYPKNKLYKLLLKKKKICKKKKTLAIIPKLIFILLAISKDANKNSSTSKTLGTNESFLCYNSSLISKNFLTQQNQLYALSK